MIVEYSIEGIVWDMHYYVEVKRKIRVLLAWSIELLNEGTKEQPPKTQNAGDIIH